MDVVKESFSTSGSVVSVRMHEKKIPLTLSARKKSDFFFKSTDSLKKKLQDAINHESVLFEPTAKVLRVLFVTHVL